MEEFQKAFGVPPTIEPPKKFTIYLAGDMTDWREAIYCGLQEQGIFSDEVELLDPTELEGQNALGDYISEELYLIQHSDIVFAYIDENSPSQYFGTTSEMMWAYANQVPVLLVNELVNLHPFHLYVSKYIRTNLQAGIDVLVEVIKGNSFTADYRR